MNATEALRSIRYELLSYIQEKVEVDFDNSGQHPLRFSYKTRRYTVREILGRFKVREDGFANGFLLRASDEMEFQGRLYCIPCFQALESPAANRRLH